MLKLKVEAEWHFPSLLREVLALYVIQKKRSGTIQSKCVILVLAAALSAVTFTGCYFFPKEEEVLAPPIKVPAEISYETLEVKRGTIQNIIRVTGNFVPVSQEDVYFTKSDRLKEI